MRPAELISWKIPGACSDALDTDDRERWPGIVSRSRHRCGPHGWRVTLVAPKPVWFRIAASLQAMADTHPLYRATSAKVARACGVTAYKLRLELGGTE